MQKTPPRRAAWSESEWQTIDVRPAVTGTIEALGIGRFYHNLWWNRDSRRQSPWTEWSRENRVVFIHVPKNAGTSLYAAFRHGCSGQHALSRNWLSCLGCSDRYHDSYSFGFVRNPWDRMVSAFQYLKHKPISDDDKRWAAQTARPVRHIRRLHDRDGTRRLSQPRRGMAAFQTAMAFPNRLGRAQRRRLRRTVRNLSRRCRNYRARDWRYATAYARRTAQQRKPYFNYYTPESRRRVARIYSKDIARYGYTWES